ncbi:MAG TPA: replication factor C large subunit [Candidatus Bathyarchaeota archaeon]|nr:replication factor C large subunit [Candidatus Bathyarchaeota archaeon]
MAHELWTVKYRPRTLSEVIGNEKAKATLLEWAKAWKEGRVPEKKAAFLYGPPGTGKTVTVQALANDLGFDLIETNASDFRTEEQIERLVGPAAFSYSLFGKPKMILFDELDGITGTADAGGLSAIMKLIRRARCPIALIANNPWDPRFRPLREMCLMVEFKRVSSREIMKLLQRICEREGIAADREALAFIAKRADGDVRSAIMDLQAVAQGRKRLTYDDVAWLGMRDRKKEIFRVLGNVFHAESCSRALSATREADVDLDMLFEWIYENVPRAYKDPREVARAMDALSKADIFKGRIIRTQDWGLGRYVTTLMTAGVALAKEHKPGFVRFQFPERIRYLARGKSERELQMAIARAIKRACHVSTREAREKIIPYLRVIFQNNPEMAAGIARWLGLDEEAINFLAADKKKAKQIISIVKGA